MSADETERLLLKIGQMLAEDVDYPVENSLLHGEVDPEMIAPAVFKDGGNHVMYRDVDLDRWSEILLDLWYAQDGPARWSEIEYFVHGGRFEVHYFYPDDPSRAGSFVERRRDLTRRYYGDRPVLYPPWEEDGAPSYTL